LLQPHRPYHRLLEPHLARVKGLAHITGGGFAGNVSRVLPRNVTARIETESWPVPAIFRLIEATGGVPHDEMYRVFNMGVGMVVIAAEADALELKRAIPDAYTIGRITDNDADRPVILV
jgi:phosphoribosylformylglycinamidine cyclo-ligase